MSKRELCIITAVINVWELDMCQQVIRSIDKFHVGIVEALVPYMTVQPRRIRLLRSAYIAKAQGALQVIDKA